MSTCGSSAATMKGNSHRVTRFHTQRSRFKSLNARKKRAKRQQEKEKEQLSAAAPSGHKQENKTRSEVADSHVDIDDIFASIGE